MKCEMPFLGVAQPVQVRPHSICGTCGARAHRKLDLSKVKHRLGRDGVHMSLPFPVEVLTTDALWTRASNYCPLGTKFQVHIHTNIHKHTLMHTHVQEMQDMTV